MKIVTCCGLFLKSLLAASDRTILSSNSSVTHVIELMVMTVAIQTDQDFAFGE
jgi:hypothetical protein